MAKRRRYFDDLPGVKRPRANFDLSHRVATTMKPGLLHPIDWVEVLPGDTWTVDSVNLTKLVTPLVRPIMDDVYLDTYSFFVPLRLCMDKLEDVFGDSSPSAYESQDLEVIPTFQAQVTKGGSTQNIPSLDTVYDYLGMITDTVAIKSVEASADYSVLPCRAFALIWNEFFRNQQVDQEVNVNKASAVSASELPNNNAWSPTNYGGQLPPVRRYGDYFSTCMLAPQKGPAVKIPGIDGRSIDSSDSASEFASGKPLRFFMDNASPGTNALGFSASDVLNYGTSNSFSSEGVVYGTNLVLGESDTGTINALRTAFQLQKYLERDAFYGSRYREYLYASYGVISQDSRLQVPEFLGGTHNRLQISQIMSTASTESVAQGQFSGQISSLSEKNLKYSKSIPEHGYVLTVAAIRYKHLYSQAVQPAWFRTRREHFYDPLFSNLGQQAIKVREIIGLDQSMQSTVFGYQENFAEYRTILDRVTGQMRPMDGNTGHYWSLADRFDGVPSLSDVVHEQTDSFDRVLTATSASGVDPFIVDFNFRCSTARVVSPYSMPGFADHH